MAVSSGDALTVGGVDVPNMPLADGEIVWIIINSGSDVHMCPSNVEAASTTRPEARSWRTSRATAWQLLV